MNSIAKVNIENVYFFLTFSQVYMYFHIPFLSSSNKPEKTTIVMQNVTAG